MKIALVYDLLYPFSIGGVETRNFSLARHLALSGHEVHLFGVKMWKGGDDLKVSKNIIMHGVSRYSSKYSFKGNRKIFEPLKYSIALLPVLMKSDFDIVDVSAFPYFPAFAAKLYCILKRKPMVITWHEVWGSYWRTYKLAGFFGRITEFLTSKLSRNNICISERTADNLSHILTKRKYIKVIDNWVDFEEINKEAQLKERYDLISIGRHMKHKNFALVLKVTAVLKARFPRIKVLIIGEGPETLNLLKIRKTLDLEDNVDILSFTKDRQLIYRYMKSSKVFVLLSELEGFSITAFEAMACGLPVVTIEGRYNSLADHIIDGVNGYVCKMDEIAIISRLSQLMKNMPSEKARKKIKEFAAGYDISVLASKIEGYYKKIAK